MNSITLAGKYLDQPILLDRFKKAVPAVLIVGGAAYSYNHISKSPKEDQQKETIKSAAVFSATIASALLAPKIADKFIKDSPAEIETNAKELIHNFLVENKVSEKAKEILAKAKEKILKYSEIKTIFAELNNQDKGKEFLAKLIPDPENIDSKHIFGEIKRLSLIGLIPVLGGVLGGIVGDKLTESDWKDRIPDKIKEGSYQYFANIFLCNIGAGVALAIMEKKNMQSKAARAIGMTAGILITGVIGGSAIANFIGKKIINPIFDKNNTKDESLFSERTPEAIDIGLHADDIATVAVMSGLKWIEPALPILYSVSGYRAGIGYRNGDKQDTKD